MRCSVLLLAALMAACGSRSGLLDDGPSPVDSGVGGTIGAGGGSGGTKPLDCRFGAEPIVLAKGIDEAHAIAVDDLFVYFTVAIDGGSVNRVAKDGGPVQVLLGNLGRPRDLALDAEHVYVTSPMDGRVVRVDKNGSNPIDIIDDLGHPAGIGVGPGGTFWVRAGPGAKNGALLRSNPPASVKTLATGLDDPGPLALDEFEAFWIENSSGGVPGVWRLSVGLTPQLLTSLPAANGNDIAVDATHVYYALNAELGRVPRTGGESEKLAEGVFIRGVALATDGNVYWVEGFDTEFGKVSRGKPGEVPEVIAQNQNGPVDVAVDQACVYWTNQHLFPGSVMAMQR